MSNLWINVSLGRWFLQIGPDYRFLTRISRGGPPRKWHRLIVHQFFGYHAPDHVYGRS